MPSSLADLQRSLDDASDARDLAKDVLRSLPDYDGNEEESTARHEIPAPPAVPSIHVHMHSEPEIPETPPVAIPGWPLLTKALVAGAGLLASAIVAYVASKLSPH